MQKHEFFKLERRDLLLKKDVTHFLSVILLYLSNRLWRFVIFFKISNKLFGPTILNNLDYTCDTLAG